jgi:hypothetical protein
VHEDLAKHSLSASSPEIDDLPLSLEPARYSLAQGYATFPVESDRDAAVFAYHDQVGLVGTSPSSTIRAKRLTL